MAEKGSHEEATSLYELLEKATKLLQERKAALEADPDGAARAAEEEEEAGEKASGKP